MAAFADDVVLVVPSWSLMAGTYRGRERVGRWFGDWMRTFRAHIDFNIRDLRENGDEVALWAHHTARAEQSGIELETDRFYHYRVRAGRIIFVALCSSWDEAVAAANQR